MTINAIIPCRVDSRRIPMKNLRLLAGEALPYYAAWTAKESNMFDEVYIVSGRSCMSEIAEECGVKFHLQAEWAVGEDARTDDFVYEFMSARGGDVTVIVNPTAPLLRFSTLKAGVMEFIKEEDAQSMFTVVKKRIHAMIDKGGGQFAPINFHTQGKLERTQDLNPIATMAFAFMGWKNEKFLRAYEANGHALFEPRVKFFAIGNEDAMDLDDEEDWQIVERLMSGDERPRAAYHAAIRHLVKTDHEERKDR